MLWIEQTLLLKLDWWQCIAEKTGRPRLCSLNTVIWGRRLYGSPTVDHGSTVNLIARVAPKRCLCESMKAHNAIPIGEVATCLPLVTS